MRRTSIWLIVAVLLATGVGSRDGGRVPKDPVGEARSAVDQFIRDFKPGMDTSDMNALTWYVRENCGALVVVRDYRIVKPYVQWLSDTVKLPDEARQNMLQTLGVLGDTAAAKVVMRYASDTSMSPGVRYEAAVAICFLGNAEAGTRVLENLALTNAVPHDALPAWQFFGSGNKPVKLKSAADEKALTLYMRWLAERATCENIIGYLDQLSPAEGR